MLKYLIALVLTTTAFAGDLPANMKAKLVKTIGSTIGATTITCKDSAVAAELQALGVSLGESKVVWAATAAEVKAHAGSGKLIIVGKLDELPLGGCIDIIEEGGKPAIYIHVLNVQKTNITLPDTVLKIDKPLR